MSDVELSWPYAPKTLDQLRAIARVGTYRETVPERRQREAVARVRQSAVRRWNTLQWRWAGRIPAPAVRVVATPPKPRTRVSANGHDITRFLR